MNAPNQAWQNARTTRSPEERSLIYSSLITESAGVVPGVSERPLSSERSQPAGANHAPGSASRDGSGAMFERVKLTRSPEDFSAYLETVDTFYAASRHLDAAAAEFERICSAPGTPDEAAFGRVEAAVVHARAEFRRLLTARVGMDAGAVERRLGL